jgi:hypothetical protein
MPSASAIASPFLAHATYSQVMAFGFLDDGSDAVARAAELEAIRRGESATSDIEAAESLTETVSSLMVSVSTGGPAIKAVDAEYKREHRALSAVLRRLGIDYPNGFDDLWRWHGRWSQGDLPRYQDRRVFVAELFSPVRKSLVEARETTRELAEGVRETPTGWPQVDAQMKRLRKLFREADDSDAFNGVGLQCVKILTSLGHVVFDPARDLPQGDVEPGTDDAKARIVYFVRRVVPGEKGENIRKLVNAAYGQANAAKHRHTATRIDAGVAANATALIVSTLRLISEEDQKQTDVVASSGSAEAALPDDIPF